MTKTRLVLPVLILTASAAGCTTYSVRRAALVPHAQPTMRDGQPIASGAGEIGAGIATLVQAQEPADGEGNAGLHIPRIQANGSLRFRASPNFDIGLIYEHGFEKGSTSIAPDQPDPKGDARGMGLSMAYSIPTRSPDFRVGLTMDLMNYSVPYIEYRTCVEYCSGKTYTDVQETRANVAVVSMGVVPSLKRGAWTYFGSLTLRSHPTVDRGGIEGVYNDNDDVRAGPFNGIAAAGISYTTPIRLRASVLVYQTLTQTPVAYAPTVAAAVTLPFGSKKF